MSSWSKYTKFKSKKRDLCYATIATTILCISFYFIGARNATAATFTTALHKPPCHLNISSDYDSLSDKVELDFAAHHTADHLAVHAPPEQARGNHVPSCAAAMSEYTPCEDAERSLKFERERLIYRERHCPEREEDALMCRVAAPYGYKVPVRWPESRDSVWYANVPHKELTVEKAGQNWVKFEGDRFRFPGGGTMFPKGADAYIHEIAALINLRDGSVRTAIDTGCGVASWGSYLLSRNILPISFAPRDTHEAQVQFALERGVPALIGILASKRLPYPSRAFDMAHCSRCLIPWGQHDGLYLIEVDRILRPGGYWILSGPPINWESRWKGWERTEEDLDSEQKTIENIARSLCWKKLVQKGDLAIWQKPTNHVHCKINRKIFKQPRFCLDQNPDNAWYTEMEACLTPLPDVSNIKETAGGQLEKWPERLTAVPPRITRGTLKGIKDEMFQENTELWRQRVTHYKSFDYQLAEKGRYRNLLDMSAHLGGFAASLVDDPVWVMNIVPVEAKIDTLGAVYERGLIGTYQNWCEAMSTYPRTYDFIHADSVFSLYKDRCDMGKILLEMDRILRPEGSIIIRDDVDIVIKLRSILDGMQYESRVVDHEKGPHEREKLLYSVKQYWTAPESDQNQQVAEAEEHHYFIPPGDQIN